MYRTHEFRDSNNNGVDDRDEGQRKGARQNAAVRAERYGDNMGEGGTLEDFNFGKKLRGKEIAYLSKDLGFDHNEVMDFAKDNNVEIGGAAAKYHQRQNAKAKAQAIDNIPIDQGGTPMQPTVDRGEIYGDYKSKGSQGINKNINMQGVAAYNALNNDNYNKSQAQLNGSSRSQAAIEQASAATGATDRVAALYNMTGMDQQYWNNKAIAQQGNYLGDIFKIRAPDYQMPDSPNKIEDNTKEITDEMSDKIEDV